jgi:hypothetical protein
MAEITQEAIYAALVRGCGRHCLPDPVLLRGQAKEIFSLIESLAEPAEMVSGVAEFVSAQVTPEELRAKSYDLAIRSGHSHDEPHLHALAAQVEQNIVNGFGEKNVETMTFKIKVDTSDMDELIRGINGRTEWRREAWNDCKAVMIRVLNKQINDPRSDSYVLRLKRQQLENVRSFISSFQFDPDMP